MKPTCKYPEFPGKYVPHKWVEFPGKPGKSGGQTRRWPNPIPLRPYEGGV